MRLIDADALKKEWRMGNKCEECERNARDCNYYDFISRMDVCSMLDDAPTVSGWVSIKDRMPPNDSTKVLTYGNPVTHWMPLPPEPPKEDADAVHD